jgi:hypothetical protein
MVVGGHHPFIGITQDRAYDLGAPARGNGEIHNDIRDADPKTTTQAFALPAGLIDVEVWSIGESPPDFLRDGLEIVTQSIDAVADCPDTKVQAEKSGQDLYNASSANPVHRGELSDRAMNSRTDTAWGHLGGALRPGFVSTIALELVASVLALMIGIYFRQLKRAGTATGPMSPRSFEGSG